VSDGRRVHQSGRRQPREASLNEDEAAFSMAGLTLAIAANVHDAEGGSRHSAVFVNPFQSAEYQP
jgi:hypothetical protein